MEAQTEGALTPPSKINLLTLRNLQPKAKESQTNKLEDVQWTGTAVSRNWMYLLREA